MEQHNNGTPRKVWEGANAIETALNRFDHMYDIQQRVQANPIMGESNHGRDFTLIIKGEAARFGRLAWDNVNRWTFWDDDTQMIHEPDGTEYVYVPTFDDHRTSDWYLLHPHYVPPTSKG